MAQKGHAIYHQTLSQWGLLLAPPLKDACRRPTPTTRPTITIDPEDGR
jgi:hypothetical protein